MLNKQTVCVISGGFVLVVTASILSAVTFRNNRIGEIKLLRLLLISARQSKYFNYIRSFKKFDFNNDDCTNEYFCL